MREKKGAQLRALLVTLAMFAALIAAALAAINFIGAASDFRQTEMVRQAVRDALVTCYAVEGRYPSNVTYLKENYGLAYDEDKYIVSCDAFASNILPEVRVSVKGESGL